MLFNELLLDELVTDVSKLVIDGGQPVGKPMRATPLRHLRHPQRTHGTRQE